MMRHALLSAVLTIAYVLTCLIDVSLAKSAGLFYLAALVVLRGAQEIHCRREARRARRS